METFRHGSLIDSHFSQSKIRNPATVYLTMSFDLDQRIMDNGSTTVAIATTIGSTKASILLNSPLIE